MDYEELTRILTKKKVLNQVADMIGSEDCPSDQEYTSNLYRILVRKLRSKIAELEEDQSVCDLAAKKLAKWVEGMMKEAYGVQCLKDVDWSKDSFEGREVVSSSSEGNLTKKESTEIYIEKVDDKVTRDMITGQSFLTDIGGQKTYVQEVCDGFNKKALVRKEKFDIKNPLVREWSTWLVDVANKTKDWVKWIEEEEQESEGCEQGTNFNWDLIENDLPESVAWRKRKDDGKKQKRKLRKRAFSSSIINDTDDDDDDDFYRRVVHTTPLVDGHVEDDSRPKTVGDRVTIRKEK